MTMDAIKWAGRLAGLAATSAILYVCDGCATLPEAGGPIPPYRPEAMPFVVKPIAVSTPRPAPARKSETILPPVTTNEVETAMNETAGRVLRSGDRLLVTIHAPPGPFSSQHVVDEKGQINLPFIGAVPVAGKSCSQAQKDIETQYIEQKYYKAKTITVIIVPPESEYSVSGEVLRPGPYPLTRNQTLQSALSRAGRYTDYADPHRVFLIRGNDRIEINLDDIHNGNKRDVVIIPGDVIEVPRRWY